MRRTNFLALIAALLVFPAAARAADPTELIRDCADDGALQGDYSASELRNARSNLPTDIDEYSDCRDVLARALAAKASSAGQNGTGGGSPDNDGGGGTTTGASSGAGNGGTAGGTGATPDSPRANGSVATDPGVETGPVTPQDYDAINDATANGDGGVPVRGRDISPRLVAEVGRNDLPGTVIAVLALVATGALALFASAIRRRVVARHKT